MSKRTFFLFAVFAIAFGLAVPYWAISKEGSEGSSPEAVAADQQEGKDLFQTNCGACHTLEKAGTDGIVGPNLDDLLGTGTPEANQQRVENAIANGIQGRMPAGILQGEQADLVAQFVAKNAGQ